ncbi:hypothetical protein RI367_004672 [Sorochytrium milnesiophthora]
MSISRYNPYDFFDNDVERSFRRMQRDMERNLASGDQSMARGSSSSSMTGFSPRIDVSEQDKQITIHADLPGIPKENIHIEAHDGALILSGETKKEQEKKDSHTHIRERQYGRFMRSISLPPTADLENVQAKFDQGVLVIDIPKKESISGRKITIS